jgi:hypothetical protein
MKIEKSGDQEDVNRVALEIMKQVLATAPEAVAIMSWWDVSKGYRAASTLFPKDSGADSLGISPLGEFIEEIEFYEIVFETLIVSLAVEPILIENFKDFWSLPRGGKTIWFKDSKIQMPRAMLEIVISDFTDILLTCRDDLDEYLLAWLSRVDTSELTDEQLPDENGQFE